MDTCKTKRMDIAALIASSVMTVFLAIVYLVCQQISFATNDDTAMAQIVYGLHTTYYDTHLVFVNVLLGGALKACLLLSPGIPWYTVFHCATVLISFFVIMYLIFSRFGILKGAFPLLLLILFFGRQYFLMLQFTKTAGIATAAGVLLLLDAAFREDEKRPYWKWILGGALTVLGSLYRFNAFTMVLIPLMGVGVYILLNPLLQRDWKRVLHICLPFVIVFAVCFGCRLYNNWEYQHNEQWAHFKEFNNLRSQLLDYGFPDYMENKDLYKSLNISYTDYEMFSGWDFADPDIFNVDAMRQLVEAKEKRVFDWNECFGNISHFLFTYRYSAAFLIAIAIALCTAKNKQGWLTAYVAFSVVAVQIYLYISGRFGLNRVDVILALALFLALVLYCWGDWQFSGKVAPILLSVLVLLSPLSEFTPKEEANEPEPLYELIYTDADKLYFCSVPVRPPSMPGPYDTYPVGYRKNYCPLGGWTTYSVPYLEKLARFDVSNPFRDMVDNPDVFLIASGDIHAKVLYINNHYNPNVAGRRVKITEDGYSIYRMTTSDEPMLDISDAVFANSLPNIHYDISAESEDGFISLSGHLFADNNNSFASCIYFGMVDKSGKEMLYYATQRCSETYEDLYNGRYGSFITAKRALDPSHFVKLYLETDNTVYCVQLGTLGQILAESATE